MATKTAQRSAVSASAPKKAAAKSSPRPARAGASTPRRAVRLDKPSQRHADAQVVDRAETRRPVAHAVVAAERAVRRNSLDVTLPVIGEVQLPAAEDVIFIGGVAGMAIVGLLEWPVAVLLGVGHGLASARHNKMLRAFGEALAEA